MTISTKHQSLRLANTARTVYHPVWYKQRAGTLFLTPHGISFRADEDNGSSSLVVAWSDLGDIFSENPEKYFLKVAHIDGATCYIIKFSSRDEASKVKADIKERWKHAHLNESMQSPTRGGFPETLRDALPSTIDPTNSQEQEHVVGPSKAITTNQSSPKANKSISKGSKPTTDQSGPTSGNKPTTNQNNAENDTDNEEEGEDRRWAFCAKLIILVFVALEAAVLTVYFVSRRNPEDSRIFGEDKVSEELFLTISSDYYIHDALVASSAYDPALSFPEMRASIGCAIDDDPEQEQENFEQAIPHIVDKGIEKFGTDRGRIIEYTDQEFELSDNYKARIKGVTLSCVIVRGWTMDIPPVAYASHLVASTLDIPPSRTEPDAYNMSLLFEADVMELGGGGVFFTPKKYCFDLDDLSDRGVMVGGKDAFALFNIFLTPPKTVAMGSKNVALSSYGNRVSWLTDIAPILRSEAIIGAYLDPKAELLGTMEAIISDQCPHGLLEDDCFAAASNLTKEITGLPAQDGAIMSAFVQIMNMHGVLLDWEAYRNASSFGGIDTFSGEEKVGELDTAAAPFLFDRHVASWPKTSGFLLASFVDPTMSQSEYAARITTPLNEAAANCVHENSTAKSFPAGNSALLLGGTRKRRLNELKGLHQGVIENWFIESSDIYLSGNFSSWNEEYLKQQVKWDENGNLQPGNLTQRRMGLTAKWYMATDFNEGDALHDLLLTHSESSQDVYSRSASAAVEMDNKCGEAATDTDIFVLILGMAATFCGAVNAFMLSIHMMLNWIFVKLHPHHRGERNAVSGCGRILPTYELGLTILGAAVFFSLYTPFILQVITEFEIYNFKTTGVDMAAENSDVLSMFHGSASLVTLVYTETQCLESRPFLLALILANGFLIGVLVNLPHVHMTFVVCARYFRRLATKEDAIPPGCTVYERNLRILRNFHNEQDPSEDGGEKKMVSQNSTNTECVPLNEAASKEDPSVLFA